jgi:hypothetical protein
MQRTKLKRAKKNNNNNNNSKKHRRKTKPGDVGTLSSGVVALGALLFDGRRDDNPIV